MQGYWIAKFWVKPPPIVVLSAEAAPDTLHIENRTLIVRFLTWRTRLCLTDTDRFIIDSNRAVMSRERVEGISIEVTPSPEYVKAPVKLPQLIPGNYVFRGFIFSNCGANDFHGFQQPDVHFTVKG